jgi:hypothetical protein
VQSVGLSRYIKLCIRPNHENLSPVSVVHSWINDVELKY